MTRRSVLRKAAVTSAVVGVGVPAVSGTVAAHACPRTPGYWKNHDWPSSGLSNVNSHVPGVDFASVEEGQQFLGEPKRGDKGQIMAFHLIAFILNNQLACLDDVTTGVADVTDADGYEGLETMLDIKALAQEWLRESGWSESNPVRSWHVSSATVQDGEVLKNLIDAYNNGTLVECSCTSED